MTKRIVISTRFGEIQLELYPEKAPKTVESFLKLVEKGFYDGTTFHRVIPGFMIQGGCPHSRDPVKRSLHGTGGPGYQLKAEFNDTCHVRGAVSMARAAHPDSAGCQFFVMVATAPHLDGQYTAFGQVVSGLEVVDQIVSTDRDKRDNPQEPVPMKIRLVGEDDE